ncbi:hypothetical protein BGX26_001393 [Mortierella sp. AD094]|nr:hypothetical protein BGX26_001393 [Mortierella sp. AD094]
MSGRGDITPTRRGRRPNQRQDESPSIIQQPVYSNPFTVERASRSSGSEQHTIESLPDIPSTPVFRNRQLPQRKGTFRTFSRNLRRDGSFKLETSSSSSEQRHNAIGANEIAASEIEEGSLVDEEVEEEEWTMTPVIARQETGRPSKTFLSTVHLNGEDIGAASDFAHDGDSTPGYARPSTPLKRKQYEAFEQSQDEVRDDGGDEDDHSILEGSHHETRHGDGSRSQDSGAATTAEIKARVGQLLQRRRLQRQETEGTSVSVLSNVFQSTSVSTSLSGTRTPRDLILPDPYTPAPSVVRQFAITRDFPTTPTGRGTRGQTANPPPLWSRAGRRAVMQLKYGIYDEEGGDGEDLAEAEAARTDGKTAENETMSSEPGAGSGSGSGSRSAQLSVRSTRADIGEDVRSFEAAILARQSAKPANSRLLSTGGHQRKVQEEPPIPDEIHVYREEDLGDALDVSNNFPKSDGANSLVSDTNDLQNDAMLDDSDYNISSADRSYSNNNNSKEMDVYNEDEDDEETKLLERRVQERVQQWMAAGGKTGSSWSSSTSAGRISRDGRSGGGAGFPYRKVGESSRAHQQQRQQQLQQQQQQQQQQGQGQDEADVEEAVDLAISELEEEVESEPEVEPETEDAKIKRLLEAEMDVELLGYQDIIFMS